MNILIDNKLLKPLVTSAYVPRKKISKLLDEVHDIIRVIGIAGSGKTTLISQWLEEKSHSYIWYTLDEDDNEFNVFLRYILRGLHLAQIIDQETYELTQNMTKSNLEAFLLSLLVSIDKLFYIVLDDFNKIDSTKVTDFLSKISQSKSRIKFIIVSRYEVAFPTTKELLNKVIVDIALKDLVFSKREFRSFLNRKDHSLSQKHIDMIYEKTEGWLMGIQLMTTYKLEEHLLDESKLNTQSINIVKKYMIEEILMKESKDLVDFVYISSLMTYFNKEICSKLLLNSDYLIDRLEKENFFIIKVNKEARTFRYHHLFKEALDSSRKYYFKDKDIKHYQQRIAKWYEENNYEKLAISTYLSSQDYNHAKDLLVKIWPIMDKHMQLNVWQSLVEEMPQSFYKEDASIQLGLGWAKLQDGHLESAKKHFQVANTLCLKGHHKEFVDDGIALSLNIGEIYVDVMEKNHDGVLKKVDGLIETCQDKQQVAVLYTLKACAYWARKDYTSVDKTFQLAKSSFNDELMHNMIDLTLVDFYLELGHLRKGDFLLDLIKKRIVFNKVLEVLNASVQLEEAKSLFYKTEFEKAYEILENSQSSKDYALDDYMYNALKLKARILLSQGLYDEAKSTTAMLHSMTYPSPVPESVTLEELESEIERGTLGAITFDQIDSDYLFKLKVLDNIANEKVTMDVIQKLEDQLIIANQHNLISRQIDLNILLSRCYEKSNNLFLSRKHNRLGHDLIEESGYKLSLSQYGQSVDGNVSTFLSNKMLADSLSKRELEVLEHMAQGLTNAEIGKRLFLTEATVKAYNKNIFRKLDVTRRTQAVLEAKRLGLIKN